MIQKSKKVLEVIFAADGIDEALHVQFDVKNEVVYRWSVLDNVTQESFGTEGEGTSIDLEEPFVIRLFNAWMLLFNTDCCCQDWL